MLRSKVLTLERLIQIILLNMLENRLHNNYLVHLLRWFLMGSVLWFFQSMFCKNIFHNIHYIREHVLQPTGYTDHQSQERLLILSSMYFLLKWCLHHTTVKGNCYIKSNYLLIFNSTLFFYLKQVHCTNFYNSHNL